MRYFIQQQDEDRWYSPWKELSLQDFIAAMRQMGIAVYLQPDGTLANAGFGNGKQQGRTVASPDIRAVKAVYGATDPQFVHVFKGDRLALWREYLAVCDTANALRHFVSCLPAEVQEFDLSIAIVLSVKTAVLGHRSCNEEIASMVESL